jgi:CRP/FNR family transcriptional regulator, cyclic AMP receptor protein
MMKRNSENPGEILRILATTGWLSEQPAEFQTKIASFGRWTTIKRGALLYAVGDDADAVYGLGEGLLDIAIPISADQEVVVHRATPGFWIGDSALLAEAKRSISISAVVDCKIFKLQAVVVHRNLKAHPEEWAYFYKLNHMNTSLTLRVLAELISLPPRARFARTLLRLMSSDATVRATQEELGRMVGMSRAAFRRAFSSLIDLGIVKVEYGAIRIRDHAALVNEANAIDD